MKVVSNYVLALRNMQQEKQQTANPPKTNQHERQLLQSGWVRVESLQKTLQQNPVCLQICADNGG